MGLGHLAGQRQGPVQRWEDNRIGFTEDRVWRYDPCGNRIAQMQADHSQQQLHYDGAHQLIAVRSEEHTSELQSRLHLVCRLLLEKKNKTPYKQHHTTR